MYTYMKVPLNQILHCSFCTHSMGLKKIGFNSFHDWSCFQWLLLNPFLSLFNRWFFLGLLFSLCRDLSLFGATDVFFSRLFGIFICHYVRQHFLFFMLHYLWLCFAHWYVYFFSKDKQKITRNKEQKKLV